MASERKPGSDRGRPAIDWEAAYIFYCGLPAERRSYQAVADEFQVSVRTVERHGRTGHWKQQAQQLDQAAAAAAAERLRDHRAEKLVDMEKLIDASCVTYATQLRDGKVRVSPADLPRLHKLRTELWNDTDTHSTDNNEQPDKAVDPTDPTERKLQVLAALRDAGVLQQLLGNDHPDQTDAGEPDEHPVLSDEHGQHDDTNDTDEREVA